MSSKTRASNPKRRTGCRTCKKRRVKCDEIKPSCIRCLESHRICDGYEIVIDPPNRSVDRDLRRVILPEYGNSFPPIRPKPTSNLNNFHLLSQSQAAAFDLFRSKIAGQLAGVRSSGFWEHVVVPASYSEPAILHASIALSNAFWGLQAPSNRSTTICEDIVRLEIIKNYNMAIQHLQARGDTNGCSSSLRVTLVACVVFIALELYTSRYEQAIMHLNEGRKLLRSLSHLSATTAEDAEAKTLLILVSKASSVEDELVSVFADLDLQSTHFGSRTPQCKLVADKPTISSGPEPASSSLNMPSFHSIQDAIQHLVILMNNCLHFVGQTLDPEKHSSQNELSNIHRRHLHHGIKSWKLSYDLLYLETGILEEPYHSYEELRARMLIQHAWLSVVIETSYIEMEETCFDDYIREFSLITDLASKLLPKESILPRPFSLEWGLVAPLYWVVLKCRHPQIRRKALSFLRRAGQEGLWEPKLVFQLGRYSILIEEDIEGLNQQSFLVAENFNKIGDWKNLIPLERRISKTHVVFEMQDCQMLCMTFWRKKWDGSGNFVGMEEIRRRQEYEAFQAAW